MAEVATKKSINIVSSQKSEVCNVQSNNSLIDLDDLTTSNNQLISLCDDDDFLLTKNTHNTLASDDKSLQELIDNELALRICSSKHDDKIVTDIEKAEEIVTRPETVKRIILDHRQNLVDINAQFTTPENEYCSLIEESCIQQNNYISNANDKDIKSELMFSHDKEKKQIFIKQSEIDIDPIIIQKMSDENDQMSSCSKSINDSNNSKNANVKYQTVIKEIILPIDNTCDFVDNGLIIRQESFPALVISPEDKYQQEQKLTQNIVDDINFSQININKKKKKDVMEDILAEKDKILFVEKTGETYSKLKDELQEKPHDIQSTAEQFKSFDNVTSQSEIFMDTTSTPEFFDTKLHILNNKVTQEASPIVVLSENIESTTVLKSSFENELIKYPKHIRKDTQNLLNEFSNESSVSDLNFLKKTEIIVSDTNKIYSDIKQVEQLQNLDFWTTVEEATKTAIHLTETTKSTNNKKQQNIRKHYDSNINEMKKDDNKKEQDDFFAVPSSRAPLATPDEMEMNDVSDTYDTESREETTINSSNMVSSSKSETKTKKKKIEGLVSNDVISANLTPRTKKTKKTKKSELGKENISVKTSFNKFDALTKKPIMRSADAGKVQQLNFVGQNGDANTNCRSCGKVVFQMEQTKAEGLVWHKNCFRCVQCSKQLNVDNYESHESTLYCKPHFKELFQPKPVEESEQLIRPRKPELIIRENEPKELPPDVVRASDKPDLGLEELSNLNVKSRFEVFEKASTENTNEIERSPSQIAVKRSPSILSKLAKFQAKGMDIGIADESLNDIPYEQSSESDDELEMEQTEEELETEIVKGKRTMRERPISFSKMDDIKNRWESTSQQGRREIQREARKEEIAGIRSRLFMGKQGKMKEMYQQAVAGSDRVTKINAAEEIQHSTNHARSLKEKFERGEPIAASDDETESKPKPEKADEEVIAAGISRKSRSHFLELDASAAKSGGPVTPVHSKTLMETPRRARDAFMGRQVSDDVVRSSDMTEEIHVETSEISNKFKFFESYKEPEKQRKQFRITPPRDGQVKMDSPDREIYRDPDVVRADDRVNEVVHTDTARKMLFIFRQMEENACKEELPEGPKPLKCFTPPPENKFAKSTASDTEEDEDEEGDVSDDENIEERDPNYIRASDKVEDEFLKQAQNAARAKTLRAKFEHWKDTDDKVNSHHIEIEMAQGISEQSSIESASSLRARFESLGSQINELPRIPKVKVNRFV